jgi:hypothetical protein
MQAGKKGEHTRLGLARLTLAGRRLEASVRVLERRCVRRRGVCFVADEYEQRD